METFIRFVFSNDGVDESKAFRTPCGPDDGREKDQGQVHRFDEPVYTGNGVLVAMKCHKCGAYQAPQHRS